MLVCNRCIICGQLCLWGVIMENNSNFWWLSAPTSSRTAENIDMSYYINMDNLRRYLDAVFFPFGYMPYYPIKNKPNNK